MFDGAEDRPTEQALLGPIPVHGFASLPCAALEVFSRHPCVPESWRMATLQPALKHVLERPRRTSAKGMGESLVSVDQSAGMERPDRTSFFGGVDSPPAAGPAPVGRNHFRLGD